MTASFHIFRFAKISCLALQARQGVMKAISRKQQDEIVDKFIKVLGISTPGPEQLVMNLSGGNQQKYCWRVGSRRNRGL